MKANDVVRRKGDPSTRGVIIQVLPYNARHVIYNVVWEGASRPYAETADDIELADPVTPTD